MSEILQSTTNYQKTAILQGSSGQAREYFFRKLVPVFFVF